MTGPPLVVYSNTLFSRVALKPEVLGSDVPALGSRPLNLCPPVPILRLRW